MRRNRLYLQAGLMLVALGGLGVFAINWWIVRSSRAFVFSKLADVPVNDVALVLGTSPLIGGKWPNPFFENRMDAAAGLYTAGKVRHLLLSGDNSRRQYDEPTAMREALIRRGVPAAAITLDYAGFRTLDSMARARAIFDLTRCTLVTDDFHLPRSLFLARTHGLQAVGFSSQPVPWKWSKKTRFREVGSRVKAWFDVFVLRTKPHFYGPKVPIAFIQ